MKIEIGDYFEKILGLVKILTKFTFAFAATAILFQLTTEIKLFDQDVIYNSSELLRILGSEKLLSIISIIILFFLFKK